MGREKTLPEGFRRRVGRMLAVVLTALVASPPASAQSNERGGGWLRSFAGPHERPVREAPAFAAEPMRRPGPDIDDSRNPRRWSPEERRQLRNDVHEAGRNVYGEPPRRRD